MNTLERTRQELDSTKQRLSSTQQSLQERDSHLTNMRQERRKQLEEILEMKLVQLSRQMSTDSFTVLYVLKHNPTVYFTYTLSACHIQVNLDYSQKYILFKLNQRVRVGVTKPYCVWLVFHRDFYFCLSCPGNKRCLQPSVRKMLILPCWSCLRPTRRRLRRK